jgi:hypothetical protein
MKHAIMCSCKLSPFYVTDLFGVSVTAGLFGSPWQCILFDVSCSQWLVAFIALWQSESSSIRGHTEPFMSLRPYYVMSPIKVNENPWGLQQRWCPRSYFKLEMLPSCVVGSDAQGRFPAFNFVVCVLRFETVCLLCALPVVTLTL